MEFRNILDEFEQLSGLHGTALTGCYPLISLCQREIEQLAKHSFLKPEEVSLLEQLTAVNAYYRYLMRQPASVTAVKVADVSVQSNGIGRLEQICALRGELLEMASGLLKDRNFVFEAV